MKGSCHLCWLSVLSSSATSLASKTCAIESGTGMTSLPVNDELLQRKIDASTQTFLDKPAGKAIASISSWPRIWKPARWSAPAPSTRPSACPQPFYNYHIGKVVHSPPSSASTTSVRDAHLSNGLHRQLSSSAPCFLRGMRPRGLNGRLLSKHRFLFMAEHPELFDSTVFAEMRGVSDGNGHSPSTSVLQKHFFSMDFPTVDYLDRHRQEALHRRADAQVLSSTSIC